jgi:hypothetical protein
LSGRRIDAGWAAAAPSGCPRRHIQPLEFPMTVIIRKLDNREHEYLAYVKSLCGKATYFVHFFDDVWGAVILYNFIEMLRTFFKPSKVNVVLNEKDLTLKNEAILELLKDQAV